MRFLTISFVIGSLLLVSATGCQTPASIQCQRETALLRAEILDLEDKYYALKSQHERMAGGASSGTFATNNVIGSGVITGGSPVIVDSYPIEGQVISGQVISGDVIYDDQTYGGAPIIQAPAEVYYDGQVLPFDGQVVSPGLPVFSPGVEAAPIPTPAEPIPLPTEVPPVDLDLETQPTESSIEDEQTLSLPDVPSLEVGFEELELDLSADSDADINVDRIEIVPSATRGKDLDGITGHDGIEVMIQAIDPDGEPVDESGELTVTVRDNLAGEIGKWTFLPKELNLFLSRDEHGNPGTLLHLPWTDRIPVSKQVEVKVSMIIGRIQYVATQQIKIKPPTGKAIDNAVAGWTATDSRWIPDRKSSFESRPSVGFQSAPFSKSPSAAVQRPQWKPVR